MKTIERLLGFLFKIFGGTIVALCLVLSLCGDFGLMAQKGAVAIIGVCALVFFVECYSTFFSRKTTTDGDEEE